MGSAASPLSHRVSANAQGQDARYPCSAILPNPSWSRITGIRVCTCDMISLASVVMIEKLCSHISGLCTDSAFGLGSFQASQSRRHSVSKRLEERILQITIEIQLQQRARIVARSTCLGRLRPLEAKLLHIELADERINHATHGRQEQDRPEPPGRASPDCDLHLGYKA